LIRDSLVALGKSNAAMALANAEATKEDRLALLSAFARRLSERNGKLDSEIAEYIKRLTAEVDFSSMGDMAMNIAADILMLRPRCRNWNHRVGGQGSLGGSQGRRVCGAVLFGVARETETQGQDRG